MNISGVLIHANPKHLEKLSEHLNALHGVEVHAATAEGKLVVTIEQPTIRAMVSTVTGLHDITGVLSVAMIYHQVGTDDMNEDVRCYPVEVPACGCEEWNTEEVTK